MVWDSWVGMDEYSVGGGGFGASVGTVWGTIEFPVPWATPGSERGEFWVKY
jgi:hypothetical protein